MEKDALWETFTTNNLIPANSFKLSPGKITLLVNLLLLSYTFPHWLLQAEHEWTDLDLGL